MLLSVFAIGIGFVLSNSTPLSIEKFLGKTPGYVLLEHHDHDWLTVGFATASGFAGLILAFVFYGKGGVTLSEQTSGKANFAIELSKSICLIFISITKLK